MCVIINPKLHTPPSTGIGLTLLFAIQDLESLRQLPESKLGRCVFVCSLLILFPLSLPSSINTYSPIMLGCQEVKDFFCKPAVPAPSWSGQPDSHTLHLMLMLVGGMENGALGGEPRTSTHRLFRLAN